eukprot:EG_transcript_17915
MPGFISTSNVDLQHSERRSTVVAALTGAAVGLLLFVLVTHAAPQQGFVMYGSQSSSRGATLGGFTGKPETRVDMTLGMNPSAAAANGGVETAVEAEGRPPARLTGETYDAGVAGGRVLVYFTAAWCGPCKAISPAVRQLAADAADLRVYTYDITTGGKEKARDLGIRSIPWFILYQDGRKLQEFSTNNPSVLLATVQARLA